MKLPNLKLDRLSRTSTSAAKVIQPPKFLRDLYADLRDRRLLPLVVLLLVAIAAVPFLLGNKGGEETPLEAQAIIMATPSSSDGSFSVVPAPRQLRAYGDRLGYRKPRDPFDLQLTGSAKGGSEAAKKSGSEESGGESSSQSTTSKPEVQAEGGEAAAESEAGVTIRPGVVNATIKAQVGVAAVIKASYVGSDPRSLEIEDQTRLPANNPAIVYTGTSKKGGALFLMTSQVTEFTGAGHCVIGGAVCQVVELKAKDSETFAIGYGETRYKVWLVGFEPIIKEEVVESEGKKFRVPDKKKNKGKSTGEGQGKIGSEPSPRSLIRSVPGILAHSFSK